MAELATIARPYAQALFAATPAGQYDTQLTWLEPIATAAAHPDVLAFAANPKSNASSILEILTLASKTTLPTAGKNFLQTLVENKRVAALPQIATQFRQLKNSASGLAQARIFSAFPLSDAQVSETLATLEKRFARKLQATVEITPELIGGIRVVVGDEVLDTSVTARLEQMKQSLLG